MTTGAINENSKSVENTPPEFFRVFFSVFLASYPLLCIYKAFYNFTIGDVILIIFLLLSVGQLSIKSTGQIALILFGAYVLLMTYLLQAVYVEYNSSAVMFRAIKFVFYSFCVVAIGKKYFDTKVFRKSILLFSLLACGFLFWQYLVYFSSGKIILGRLGFLELYLNEYADINYETIFSYYFRPSSFFLEPAQFVQYVCVAIAFIFFDFSLTKKQRIMWGLCLVTGVVMSTAGQGIAYLAILFVGLLIKRKSILQSIFFILIFTPILFLSYHNIEVLQMSVDRLLFNSHAAEARLGGFEHVFNLEGMPFLLGYGYGVTNNEYLAGAVYVWYGLGVAGLLFAMIIFGVLYADTHSFTAKIIWTLFLVMFFTTSLFYNYMFFWFLTIILYTKDTGEKSFDEDSVHTWSV